MQIVEMKHSVGLELPERSRYLWLAKYKEPLYLPIVSNFREIH